MKTHYDTLGIKTNATQEEVKVAFRKAAHLHHPDKGGDAEKFKEASAAYAVLQDPAKRRSYDFQMGIFARPTYTYTTTIHRHEAGQTVQRKPGGVTREDVQEAFRQKMAGFQNQAQSQESVEQFWKRAQQQGGFNPTGI